MQSTWTRSERGGNSARGDGDGGKPPKQGKGDYNNRGRYCKGILSSAFFDTSEERGSSTGDGGNRSQYHNDHGHQAEDPLPSDAPIKAVAELLRVENLDFTVLDKIKQVALALESDPQKANIIIQLAYAIVAARGCSSDITRKNETAVTGDADKLGDHGGHKNLKREHDSDEYA